MRKILFILFFCLVFCRFGFAQPYYFKECKLSEKISGDYLIDLKKNEILVTLKSKDGTVQEFVDKIKLVTKDRIVSEIIQQENKQFSTQYFLNSNSKSISRQLYKREIEIDLIRPEGPPKTGYCSNVKSNWYKSEEEKKIEEETRKIKLLEKSIAKKSSLPVCGGIDINNWTNCRGTYMDQDEYKYIGEWKNGKQDGIGIELLKDGRKYVGQFKNDKRHGKGIFTMSDGTKFTGNYKNGKKDGPGTFSWANGDEYVGEYKDGKANGKGVYTFSSGTILSGQFKDGQIFKGSASYIDGTKYIGEFKFDLPNGYGTLIYSNRGKYIGQFIDGYEYGEGICVKPNGEQKKCILPNRDIYIGKNRYSISIVGGWHKLEQQLESREILITNFNNNASEYCILSGIGDFKELEKKIKVHEVDETPAFGLDPKYKLIIQGIVECQ